MEKRKVIAKVLFDGVQKRVTIPKQPETEDWVKGDVLKLEKIEVD